MGIDLIITLCLQLITTTRLDSLALLICSTNLRVTKPSQGSKPLCQDWVREVVTCIHPVRIHGAQVLDLQLNQRACQFGRVTQFLGEFVGLEFITTAEDIHQKLDDSVHWCKSIREEDEADYDGEFIVETEGLVQGFVVDEDRKQGEDVEEMYLNKGQ
jgi:hypothetical protein